MTGEIVRIFDTSLRDGEQAPGFSMDMDAKLKLATELAKLNVDVIEAGFAAASPGDFVSIARIAESIEGPIICSLARARAGDIMGAALALKPARNRRIHVFISTSPIHRKAKLGMDCGEVVAAIRAAVALAREQVDDVEFSAEDAIRTEPDFLAECLSVAAGEGATTLNVPDTVGYATPREIRELFSFLLRSVDRPQGVIFSAHCHDDLGLACANSLAAIEGGARQVECTLHGIGERAGNCALEELVMALEVRPGCYSARTGIRLSALGSASRALSEVTGISPAPNKAIVGANAFSHESGIHQHGVLKDRSTYEIMDANCLGLGPETIVLGKHSGRHAFKVKAAQLGFMIGAEHLDELFREFKSDADRLGTVTSQWFREFLERRVGRQEGEER